jgi:hypothetical protein
MDEDDFCYGMGREGSPPNQTDAPENVLNYDDPEPEVTHAAGSGGYFISGGRPSSFESTVLH